MVGEVLSLEDEDLIEEEDVMVTLTHNGYIKRMATSEFKTQNRGGRGIQGWVFMMTTLSNIWFQLQPMMYSYSSPMPVRFTG